MSQELYNVLAILAFEQGVRETLIDTLEGAPGVQSVDVVEIKGDETASSLWLVVDITSEYSTAEYQNDSAWELIKALSVWWEPEGLWWSEGAGDGLNWPAFRFVVSGTEWYCSDETMRGLADHRVSRAQWEADCSA